MSEYIPERMSNRMSEYINIYIYAIVTSRRYTINYVRKLCSGGDHKKKVIVYNGEK